MVNNQWTLTERIVRSAALLVLLSILAACTATKAEKQEQTALSRLLVYDLKLGHRLDIGEVKKSMAGNLMKIQVEVKNEWHSDISFQYKTVWYDADEMTIDADSKSWHPVSLRSQANTVINALAPNSAARDYVIHIKD